jgi:hypothetical protein
MHNATRMWIVLSAGMLLGGYLVHREQKPQEPAVIRLVLESDKGRSPEFVRLRLDFGPNGKPVHYGWTADGLRWVERDGEWWRQAYDDFEAEEL